MQHTDIKQADSKRMVIVLGLSSFLGLAMLAFRIAYSGRRGYWSLPWDLFLAWIPLLLATAVERIGVTRKRLTVGMLLLAFGWLLFFPNAPYLVTEFMHLSPRHAIYDGPPRIPHVWPADWGVRADIPVWFDVLMLATYAWTGLLLGFFSLHLIHGVAARVAGRIWGWLVVVVGVGLCAFGVSLGRFERWNSWDLLAKPVSLASDVSDRVFNPLAHPRTSAVTIGFAAFLLLAYLSLVALMRLGPAADISGPSSPATD
jgi:uncharacterized membrane protein